MRNVVAIVCAVALLFSFFVALSRFDDPISVKSESSASSALAEESIEESVESTTSDSASKPGDVGGEYYNLLKFEEYSYQNSDVVNGNLAIIKDSANGYPDIHNNSVVDDEMVKFSAVWTSNVYGLSNYSVSAYNDAALSFDKFIVSFYSKVPKNGLIIREGYTPADTLNNSDGLSELSTGYSVRFSIYNSNYTFGDDDFSYLYEQAFRYGIIQRYPEGEEINTSHDADYTLYRYVGLAHSYYMNYYRYSLEEYIDKLRTDKIVEFKSGIESNTAYVIYYVSLSNDKGYTDVPVPTNANCEYSVSGDGSSGFIVTVKIPLK